VDLNEELDFVLSIVEKEMHLNCIEIERQFTDESWMVHVDPDRMRQVFLNLFNNALHAMPCGGVLTIRTDFAVREVRRNRRKEDAFREPHELPVYRETQFRIQVIDTGTGIKKENLQKIFDPFFTTKPEGKGTGLGMSVCYAIIDQHGGMIEVESEEGQGTTVQIWLPILSKEAAQPLPSNGSVSIRN
jgi:signal transduction histidine kinase